MAQNTASRGATGPLGKNPPWTVYWGATRPLKRSAVPATMKATMVASLIMENQNSKRPKEPTLRRLTSTSRAEKRITQTLAGTDGNQWLMYVAEATSSAPMEKAIEAQ